MTLSLKDLLGKYENLSVPSVTLAKEISSSIFSVTGIEIAPAHISLSKKQFFITLHPLQKRLILKYKKEILAELLARIPNTLISSLH